MIGVVECSSIRYRKVVSEWDCWRTSALRHSLIGISGRRIYYKWWEHLAGGFERGGIGYAYDGDNSNLGTAGREKYCTSQGYNL